jgi:hypothetical protein
MGRTKSEDYQEKLIKQRIQKQQLDQQMQERKRINGFQTQNEIKSPPPPQKREEIHYFDKYLTRKDSGIFYQFYLLIFF